VLCIACCGARDGVELEIFLGVEVRCDTALAHADLAGEAGDGEAFEPLGRGDVGGCGEDLAPSPVAGSFPSVAVGGRRHEE